MTAFMKELRGKVAIGVVGGSDTTKIKEQLGILALQPYSLLLHFGVALLQLTELCSK